jgi:transglutaminase-like putative cysteine protease
MSSQAQAPQSPALVVNRWNSWVQVWFPDTDSLEWVDLGSKAFEPTSRPASVPAGSPAPAPKG